MSERGVIKRVIKRLIKRLVYDRLIGAGSCVVGAPFGPHTQPDHGNQVVWFVYRDLIKPLDYFLRFSVRWQSDQAGNQVVAFNRVMKV